MPSPNAKSALVLSGGSIKGSFQAGAIREILDRGFQPEAIYGISVGSLNGAFLTNGAGAAIRRGEKPNWKALGLELWKFWEERIKSPDAIVRKRSVFTLLWAIIRNRFDGLTDTQPLRDLVRATLKSENLSASPVIFKAGCINMASGEMVMGDKSSPQLVEYVMGSAAIPILMPLVQVSGAPLTDGGVRDVAMIGQAIDTGATRIVAILCQPQKLSVIAFSPGNLGRFVGRLLDIIVNETVNNDLATAERINALCPADGSPVMDGPLKGKRRVQITVIRPPEEVPIELDKFTSDDIRKAMEMGRNEAKNSKF
jgi:NTE family protein